MSDFPPPSSPDDSPSPPGGLPAKRNPNEAGPPLGEESAQPVSLEEMMERLQRSGSSERSSSSGRRRRRSSSTGSGGTRASSRSLREPDAEAQEYAGETAHHSDRPRAVLPPPRRRGDEFPSTARSPKRIPGPKRSRRWMFWVAALLLAALGTWFGIRLLNRWRVEGEGFRISVSRRLSELTDRRVSTARFRQTATDQLATATLAVQPSLKDLLASATCSNVIADFAMGSWLADDWTIRSLRLNQIDLVFQPDRKLDEQNLWALQPDPVDRGISRQGGFRIGLTSDPAAVLVEEGRFDQLNVSWPGPDGTPESLTQMQGTFRTVDQALHLEIAGGLLDTAAWPPFAIGRIMAKLKGTSLEITGARLGFTAGHEVRVAGSAQLTPDGSLQLTGDIQPVLLKHLLPERWAGMVMGSFESTGAAWTSHFKSGTTASLSGPFRVKGFVLRGFPFVDKIAAMLRKPELILMEFPVLTGQFQWTPIATHLTGLTATTADGLLRLQGKATITPGETVSAEWVVEANEAFFAGQPPEAVSLFTPGPEGWRQIAFTLGGIEDAVTDSIGMSQPVMIQNRPAPSSVEMPRMTLPPGVVAPEPPAPKPTVQSPAPLPPGNPPPRNTIRSPTTTPPPVPRPPSDAELEKQFKDLLRR